MEASDVIRWIERVDTCLDLPLASTLAGLALAVAAFLLPVCSEKQERHKAIVLNGGQVPQAQVAMLADLQRVTRRSINAFFCFLVFMVSELTLQSGANVSPLPDEVTLPEGLSVAVSGGAGGAGMYFLFRAAQKMKKLI